MENTYIEIPLSQLDRDTLQAVLEEFITREGTDYGHEEYSLAQKVSQVRRQIEQGQAQLVFDPITESCTVLVKE